MQGGYRVPTRRANGGKERHERSDEHETRRKARAATERKRKRDSTEAGSAYRKRKRDSKRLLMVMTEGCYRHDARYERG